MDRHHHNMGQLVNLSAASAFPNTCKWLKKTRYLFVGMPVLKPKSCSTCKSHISLWKVMLSFYCGPNHWLFAAINTHPYPRVVILLSCLTGINLFSCSFSASTRLWELPLAPAQHSARGWSPSLPHGYRDSPAKHPGTSTPPQRGQPTSLTSYNL